MKKLFFFTFLFTAIAVYGQTDQSGKDDFLFQPTEIGKPDGEKNSAIIGKEGGRIESADKKIELVFPEGALKSKTTISIQPSTNTSVEGIGKGYELQPSGMRFQKPVQLVLHYSDKDTEDGSPQLMTITTQDDKGIWYRLRKIKLDTVSKTITGEIKHFSFWALGWSFYFKAEKSRVKVSKRVKITAFPMPIGDEHPGDRHDAIIGIFGEDFKNISWFVNGILKGDATNGTIDDPLYPGISPYLYYKAPANVPEQNPVEIMLELKGVDLFYDSGFSDHPRGTITKKCKIKVYDNYYKVKMVTSMKANGPATWGGAMTYEDEGSFLVSLDEKIPKLLDIKNNFEKINYNACSMVVLNPVSNTGMIHVTGIRSAKITPAKPPQQPYAIVEIVFTPNKAEFTTFSYACKPPRGIKRGASGTMVAPMMISMPAMPVSMKFIANDKQQVIQEFGKPGDDLYFKISVKKMED